VNIAVFLDGTWSDANTHTNIAQIHARVPRRSGGAAQELCYVEGVGTGRFDRLRGGASAPVWTTTSAGPTTSSRRTIPPMPTASTSSATAAARSRHAASPG
jgi:hypothetical protein